MDRQKFLELVEPAIQILEKKHQDYNRRTGLEDYFPFGDKSHVQMIHVKSQRLVSLADTNIHGYKPNFESVRDSVLDLVNYAVFYLAFLEDYDNEHI